MIDACVRPSTALGEGGEGDWSADFWESRGIAEFGILEAHEVAELLTLRHSTVLDLSRSGVLPAFKIGKRWRYRRADLEEWMVRRRDAV